VPGSEAWPNQHDLIAKVVGGTVNDSGDAHQGILTLNEDVLFTAGSAALSGTAARALATARSMLHARADLAKPVDVIGYGDTRGKPANRIKLSQQRATAVARALRARGGVGPKAVLRVSGRGDANPVARNTRADGGADGFGQTLNRRVEIHFVPRAGSAASPTATPAPPSLAPTTTTPGTTGTTGSGSTDRVLRLAPVTISGADGPAVPVVAAVHPILADGTLTLVRLDLTAQGAGELPGVFSARSPAASDLSAFSVVDPATVQAFVPVYDADNYIRVLGTYLHRLSADQTFHLDFYVAGLPAGLRTATVVLGPLGDPRIAVER
jgi:outer membrane protein OmpA-like peptidoglycan-associated protein